MRQVSKRIKRYTAKAWRGVKREWSRRIEVERIRRDKSIDPHEREYYFKSIHLLADNIIYANKQISLGILPNGKKACPVVYRALKVSSLTVLINRIVSWIKEIWRTIKGECVKNPGTHKE